jgi:hypothetical protein
MFFVCNVLILVFCRGSAPLHYSSYWGRLVLCQFLVEKGADVNAKENMYGTQPYAYAYKNPDFSFVYNVLILVSSVEV